MQHLIQPFYDTIADPEQYVRLWKQKTGGKVVGTLCSYSPEELIFAAGGLGFRILGSGSAIVKADAHLQAYCCSLVRGALEDALSGRFDFLDGMIFPHTCDSIQRLSDLWRMNANTGFHLDAVLPVKLNTDSAGEYMRAVLSSVSRELAWALGVTLTDADLIRAVSVFNDIRATMAQLYALRRKYPGLISGSDYHSIVKASMVMDRLDFLAALKALVAAVSQSAEPVSLAGKRLMLSGGICNMPNIYDWIEAVGGVVVEDDLCTGTRQFTGLIDTTIEPLAAIADRYTQRVLCPAKHAGIRRRGQELVRQAKTADVQGVIFLLLKFCDPHAFDYPYLKNMLQDEGIPSLKIELEDQSTTQGQFQTRCQAFLEML